jgi:hypothetical protein
MTDEELADTLAGDLPPSDPPSDLEPVRGHRWTSETAREARKLRGTKLQRGGPEAPADADIEAGLRKRAKDDPRAAEVLLRWLNRPRPDAVEDELDGLSRGELERLHTRLQALCSMEESAFERVLAQAEDGR